MAELVKKLYIKNLNDVIDTARLYSTTNEIGGDSINLNVDDVNCYAAICTPTDANATNGRILKNDTTFAIKKLGEIPYSYTVYSSSGTFTVPAGVKQVRVTVVGGGGGGTFGEHKDPNGRWNDSFDSKGNDGGTSSALGVSATGGKGSFIQVKDAGYDPDSGTYLSAFITTNGTGGTGATLLNSIYYGSGAGENQQVKWFDRGISHLKARGGNGYTAQKTIAVTQGTVYAITVGGGGMGRHYSRLTEQAAVITNTLQGGGGAVQIEWGKGI